ncbi:SMC-Scp complex subunit ScpB [Deinococcus ruber]|uniref:SMC-Scp complex subunit ScpB n=1 Tax=Deinococcus ruber TaxID=1848197 RepID=UPI001E47B6B8|nr:SMC-Scp complex subunit ScpB [Deinococcus ruber]
MTESQPSEKLSPHEHAQRELLGAALLASGRPLTLRELEGLLELAAGAVAALIERYARSLEAMGAGFRVESVADGYRLVVAPALAARLAPILAPPPLPALSSAALEVLAVIAYRQPITRAEIEAMRGGSASTVLTLQERELIKVVGKSPSVGQPLLYGTTERFLLEFGLNSLNDLPELSQQNFSGLLRG